MASARSVVDALLQDRELPGHPPEEVARARRLAKDPATANAAEVASLPLPLAEAVLAAAVRSQVVALPETLAVSNVKSVAKLAKKALYQLRSSGLDVPEVRPVETARPVTPHVEASFPCFLSPVNGTGERAVLLHRFQGSRVETLYVVVSDEHGVVQSVVGEATRSRFAKMVKMLRSEERADIEIPISEAKTVVADAAALNLATRSPFPDGLSEALRHFEISPAQQPFAVPPPEEGDVRLSTEGHTLHEQPEIASWMPTERDLKVLVQKLAAIESSPLQLTPAQRAEQLTQTLREHARAAFTPEVRKVYSRRLWTMGDYFERTTRAHLAEVARAEARRLAHDPGEPFSRFAEALFEKVLRLMAAPAGDAAPTGEGAAPRREPTGGAEQKSAGGLILTP